MVIDLRRKRFVMNMQLRQCFARTKPIRLKVYFQKAKGVKKKPEFLNLASKNPNWQPCYTRIENVHEVHKKTFIFLLCIEVQQIFSFSFPLLRHYEVLECFYVKNCCF